MWAVLALAEIVGFVAVLVLRYGQLTPASASRLTFAATMFVAAIAVIAASWLLSARSVSRFIFSILISLVVFGLVGFVTWTILVSLAGTESWSLTVSLWALMVVDSLGVSAPVSALVGRVVPGSRVDATAGGPA